MMEKKTYADMRSNWEFGEASECRKGLMCGMGYTVEEQRRPLIGVVNSWNEYNPGHVHLKEIAQRVKDGVRFYNDSIASSPSRTIAGLNSFSEKVLLIAGGYDKHIPYDVLGPEVCRHVKKLYLGGATGPKIRAAVENCPEYDPRVLQIEDCGDFDGAVYAAVRDAKEGDIVLMSPASASFDQFKNFEVRGDHFKKLIKEL